MRHLLTRLAVGLTTFLAGVCAAMLFVGSPRSVEIEAQSPVTAKQGTGAQASPSTAELCSRLWNNREVSDESKAIMAAQSFITLEGYTDGVMGSCNMALPCVEGRGQGNNRESYRNRYDTLECQAYGVSHLRKGGERGWTVVFKYTERMGGARMKTGRAVTMDENFMNLRVEHCDFFLNKVEEKL
jgi:hypothetical protein